MIKELFFDIDGTLVSFENHQIPSSAIEALDEAHKKGVKVFIATGRPKAIINNLGPLEERGIIDGYVTMNGAYCFVDNEIVFSQPIDHQSVVCIGKYAQEKGLACIFVPDKDIRVCNADDVLIQIFYERLHVDKIPETPFFNIEQEAEVISKVSGIVGNRWHPGFTDITATGINKSHGVQLMAEHFNISKDEVMCFGDGGNDIPMLEYAGIGVALGNANDDVKSHADYITTHVDDNGVANALKHFGII